MCLCFCCRSAAKLCTVVTILFAFVLLGGALRRCTPSNLSSLVRSKKQPSQQRKAAVHFFANTSRRADNCACVFTRNIFRLMSSILNWWVKGCLKTCVSERSTSQKSALHVSFTMCFTSILCLAAANYAFSSRIQIRPLNMHFFGTVQGHFAISRHISKILAKHSSGTFEDQPIFLARELQRPTRFGTACPVQSIKSLPLFSHLQQTVSKRA